MFDIEKQEKRIAKILGKDEIPVVSYDTLGTYLDYLKKNLEFPCHLTGIEDLGAFGWEEYYTIGPGSKKDHERLRKTRASYMDTFEFLNFDDEVEEDYGILVNVKRVSDKKKFVLPLADLEASDEQSKNYQLINDFVVWFVNWR